MIINNKPVKNWFIRLIEPMIERTFNVVLMDFDDYDLLVAKYKESRGRLGLSDDLATIVEHGNASSQLARELCIRRGWHKYQLVNKNGFSLDRDPIDLTTKKQIMKEIRKCERKIRRLKIEKRRVK